MELGKLDGEPSFFFKKMDHSFFLFGRTGFFVGFAWAFSSCGEWGLLLTVVSRASHRGGFSCCGVLSLGAWALVVAAHRL